MFSFRNLLAWFGRLGLSPYLVGFDAAATEDRAVDGGGAAAPVVDLAAYRLKKFPMAHRRK